MDSHGERAENLAQLIKRIRDTYNVNESQIARAIGVTPATVNSWTQGRRGTKRGPNPEKLRALAREYPKFTEVEIFAAANRAAPGPLSQDAEEQLLDLFRGLTEEQQRMKLIELKALNDSNKR
ncbi:helix-turn-helix transcriptional regulator [Streptomyces sp. NPDC047971]|uniref:helix-turn-helix domain-containing protein n=1 Tax=Streptomyces sp. NPDC047971 TaxID=3154499 RepID=UPI0033F02406